MGRWTGRQTHTQPKDPGEVGLLTLALIEKAIMTCPSIQRVYITGLSMEGTTWDFVARRPDLSAAAVLVRRGRRGHSREDQGPADLAPTGEGHGRQAGPIAEHDRRPEESRGQAGTPNTRRSATTVDTAYKDPELFKWLFAQKKH